MSLIYDFVIIGGGIAGLYSAYKIIKESPHANIIIFEKDNRFGGRIHTAMFAGFEVKVGAGTGRKNKDIYWQELLEELDIRPPEYKFVVNYAPTVLAIDLNESIKDLKNAYEQASTENKMKTFREFGTMVLGKEKYKQFIQTMGYTDYENEDIYEVVYNYGVDDNSGGWTGVDMPWRRIINSLVNDLIHRGVVLKLNKTIDKIQKKDDHFRVYAKGKVISYKAKNIIVATTVETIKHLLPVRKYPIYRQVKGQPFLRLYAQFDTKSAEILSSYIHNYCVVAGPLQKIIPISGEKGVYMVAYSDNKNAQYLKNKDRMNNKEYIAEEVRKALAIPESEPLKIIKLKPFYWNVGTHYYTPLTPEYQSRDNFLNKAQRPMPHVWVVGEAISTDQGWSQGALDSVEKIKDDLFDEIRNLY